MASAREIVFCRLAAHFHGSMPGRKSHRHSVALRRHRDIDSRPHHGFAGGERSGFIMKAPWIFAGQFCLKSPRSFAARFCWREFAQVQASFLISRDGVDALNDPGSPDKTDPVRRVERTYAVRNETSSESLRRLKYLFRSLKY